MNITFYTNSTDFPDYRSLTSATGRKKTAINKSAGDYDKFTVKKSPLPADETSFARVLAREAAVKLESGVSQERVMNLQQQVASGAYQPDSRRIAERMLGYR